MKHKKQKITFKDHLNGIKNGLKFAATLLTGFWIIVGIAACLIYVVNQWGQLAGFSVLLFLISVIAGLAGHRIHLKDLRNDD